MFNFASPPFASPSVALMPIFPLPCCETNCEVPMVKPCPVAMVVVPDVCVNCPRPKYPVPETVSAVDDAYGVVTACVVAAVTNRVPAVEDAVLGGGEYEGVVATVAY